MPHELRPPLTTGFPMWETDTADPDLDRAAHENPTVATWLHTLASLGETTMVENRDDLLYSQAPDALRQQSVEPTPEAIEAWVRAQQTTHDT